MKSVKLFILLLLPIITFRAEAAWEVKEDKKLDVSTDFSFGKYPEISQVKTYMVRDTNEDVYQRIMIGTLKTPEPMVKIQYYRSPNFFSYWNLKDSFDNMATLASKHSIELSFDKKLPNLTIANKKFELLSFKSVAYGQHTHMCLMYQNQSSGNDEYLKGWVCSDSEDIDTQNLFRELIFSIQIKDESGVLIFDGRKFRSSAALQKEDNNSPVNKSRSDHNSQSKAERLKEAKDLFKQDIITKGEYEQLRKKILGIN